MNTSSVLTRHCDKLQCHDTVQLQRAMRHIHNTVRGLHCNSFILDKPQVVWFSFVLNLTAHFLPPFDCNNT